MAYLAMVASNRSNNSRLGAHMWQRKRPGIARGNVFAPWSKHSSLVFSSRHFPSLQLQALRDPSMFLVVALGLAPTDSKLTVPYMVRRFGKQAVRSSIIASLSGKPDLQHGALGRSLMFSFRRMLRGMLGMDRGPKSWLFRMSLVLEHSYMMYTVDTPARNKHPFSTEPSCFLSCKRLNDSWAHSLIAVVQLWYLQTGSMQDFGERLS